MSKAIFEKNDAALLRCKFGIIDQSPQRSRSNSFALNSSGAAHEKSHMRQDSPNNIDQKSVNLAISEVNSEESLSDKSIDLTENNSTYL